MKTTSEYIELLRQYKRQVADKYGIIRLGIFGSVARNKQQETSDVDICIETRTPSMFTLVHIKEDLQSLFGCPIDIVRLQERMDTLLKKEQKKRAFMYDKDIILILSKR